jgi:anti-anti-sigma factor
MRESDGVIVLEPTQDLLEGGECDEMEALLGRLAGRGERVIVDVSQVRHLTARCLGILAHAQRAATERGGSIALCGASRMQRWLLRRTGLARALSIHDDLAAAKRHLAALPRAVA